MTDRDQFIRSMLGRTVHVVIDRPIGFTHGDIRYPVNYGCLPGVMAPDGEEQDVYVLGVSEPLDTFDGQIIGAIRRKNDCEDKLVAAPAGTVLHQAQIAEAVRFQEQYFETTVESIFRKSCGVLPYRGQGSRQEYLLVYESYSRCWSLPKGHMEPGETEVETALRELKEETGLTARLDADICASIEYPVFANCRKQVVFFPGQVCGTLKPQAGEIGGYRWVREEQLKDFLFPDTTLLCTELIRKLKK